MADQRGVFLSWSKAAAAEIAKLLKPFLEDVLGTESIFMSQAMEGGTRWSLEIPQWLEACNAGLVIVTSENTHEPWLHFEAGALSKQLDDSRVVPLLFGASVGEIQGTPLSLFQAKSFDREDFLSVCLSFGAAFHIPEDVVRRRFETNWGDLNEAVGKIPQSKAKPTQAIGAADLMAVLERVSGQVTSIENQLKGTAASLEHIVPRALVSGSGGMFGGGKSARLSDLLFAYSENPRVPAGRAAISGSKCPTSGYWRIASQADDTAVWVEAGLDMPENPPGEIWVLSRAAATPD